MLWKAKEARSGVLYMISTNQMLVTSIKWRDFDQGEKVIHTNVNNGKFFLMVTEQSRSQWRFISPSRNRAFILQIRNTRI